MKHLWKSGLGKISESLPIKIPLPAANQLPLIQMSPLSTATLPDRPPSIVFVLSLAGRYQTFLRFMRNYETVCLEQTHSNTDLLLVLFRENIDNDLTLYYNKLDELQLKYPDRRLSHITLDGNFSRGIALNEAVRSSNIRDDQIIFLIDVDIVFTRESLDRIRMNTIKNQQVYLPIVFSDYNPNRNNITLSNSYDIEAGYFRQFGFGICAIYKIDIMHPDIDGFNTDITGWGLEDVKFLERLVKLSRKPNEMLANIVDTDAQPLPADNLIRQMASTPNGSPHNVTTTMRIFRAPDPSLVHIYHDIYCDKTLNDVQYVMCLGTKANTLGSYRYIESLFVNNKTIIDYIGSIIKAR